MEKAKYTSKCMMIARGYRPVNKQDNAFSEYDCNLYERHNKSDLTYILFPECDKINVSNGRFIDSECTEYNIKHLIIVYSDKITPSAEKLFKLFNINIETFCQDKLQYNITEHNFVPKHEKVSAKEKNKILNAFGSGLPKLLMSDPVARFYGYELGDIIKICRKNNEVIYRKVVQN